MKKMTEQDAKRLAAYEATGLTPEEVVKMKRAWENCKRWAWKMETELASVKKVREGE